jgi:hypothetical protein
MTETSAAAGPKTKKITIHINDKPYHFDGATVSVAEIKQVAGIPAANLLFLEVPGPGDDLPVTGDVITIKSGQHYYDMPPGNFGADA